MRLRGIARRLSAYCEAKGLLPEKQGRFRPDRSTTDMMFVGRRLQEIEWKAGVSLFMCFIYLQNAYDTVGRALLWQVLNRIGVPPQMIAVIQQFHDGMRACVRTDDGVCSDWFEVEQGLRQGCGLSAPWLFTDMMFVGRRLQEIECKAGVSLHVLHRSPKRVRHR